MNNPWDRVIWNEREKPLSSDWNRALSQIDQTMREFFIRNGWVTGNPEGPGVNIIGGILPACVSDSFRLQPVNVAGLTVRVTGGYGFVNGTPVSDISGVVGLNDLSAVKPLVLLADADIIAPVASGSPRIDIVEIKPRALLTDNAAKLVLNPGSGIFVSTLKNKTLQWILDGDVSVNGSASINYKSGTPAANPVAPAVTAGYYKLGELLVPVATTTFTWEHISDKRQVVAQNGTVTGALAWTQPNSNAVPTGVINMLPPGFRYAIRVATTGATADIYIMAPANFSKGTCVAQADAPLRLATGNAFPYVSAPATLADKAVIEGANVSPSTARVLATNGAASYNGHNLFHFAVTLLELSGVGPGATIGVGNSAAIQIAAQFTFQQ